MGVYHVSVDRSGRIVVPREVRDFSLPDDKLGIVVEPSCVPGNQRLLEEAECICIRLIPEGKYNDIVSKIKALPQDRFKRDVQQWFERYVCLRPVDGRGRLSLPKSLIKDVLAFEPPGQLVLLDAPGEVTLTTFELDNDARKKAIQEIMSDPAIRDDLGL